MLSIFASLVAAAASVAGAQAVSGPEARKDAAVPASPADVRDPVENLTLAYRLADHARERKDARAMIVAARIAGTMEWETRVDGGSLSRPDPSPRPVGSVTAATLYAEARELAEGDQQLLGEVETAQAEASRGVGCPYLRGCMAHARYVPGETIWSLQFPARGGEPLVVGARRDAAAFTSMRVLDEHGNLVCKDISGNPTMYCRVNPIWTGVFKVQIVNHGKTGTGVRVVTN